MRILLLIFIITTAFQQTLHSQCKFEKNEFDEFEDIRIVITKHQPVWGIGNEGKTHMSFGYFDNLLSLRIDFGVFDASFVNEGEKAIFIFDDNEKYEVFTLDSYNSDYEIINGRTYWNIVAWYEIDSELLSKFSKSNMSALRIYYSNGYKEYHIKKKSALRMKSMAQCFLDEVK